MLETAEKDDELWLLVTAYQQYQETARDIKKEVAQLKSLIFKKLAAASEDGNYAVRYRGNTRVRAVEVKNTDFSVSDLRRKYGEDFVEENRIDRYYDTIEVKVLEKAGPPSSQC